MDSSTGKHSGGDTANKQFIESTDRFLEALSNKRT